MVLASTANAPNILQIKYESYWDHVTHKQLLVTIQQNLSRMENGMFDTSQIKHTFAHTFLVVKDRSKPKSLPSLEAGFLSIKSTPFTMSSMGHVSFTKNHTDCLIS